MDGKKKIDAELNVVENWDFQLINFIELLLVPNKFTKIKTLFKVHSFIRKIYV